MRRPVGQAHSIEKPAGKFGDLGGGFRIHDGGYAVSHLDEVSAAELVGEGKDDMAAAEAERLDADFLAVEVFLHQERGRPGAGESPQHIIDAVRMVDKVDAKAAGARDRLGDEREA